MRNYVAQSDLLLRISGVSAIMRWEHLHVLWPLTPVPRKPLRPYDLVFNGWGARSGFPMKELSAYTAWEERMMQRPTVKKSVESEESVSA